MGGFPERDMLPKFTQEEINTVSSSTVLFFFSHCAIYLRVILFFLAVLHCIQDLSCLSKDQIHIPCIGFLES